MLSTLLLAAAPTMAGTLLVRGPSGADVFLDGQLVGKLPWSGAMELEQGPHDLRASLRGYYDYETSVVIRPGEAEMQLDFTMERLSKSNALGRSLLLAGLGQRYVGRNTTGWVLTIAEALGIAGFALGEFVVQSKREDFEEAERAYRTSVDEAEITRLRAEAESAFSDMESAKSLRDTSVALAAGAVALGVLDVLLRFPGVEAGSGQVPWNIGAQRHDPSAVHFAWSLSF